MNFLKSINNLLFWLKNPELDSILIDIKGKIPPPARYGEVQYLHEHLYKYNKEAEV